MVYNDKPWAQQIEEKPRKVDQALLNACYFDNLIKVKKYLRLGANPNYMEKRDGWCPIHYSARWGNIPMTLTLLKWGANMDGLTNSRETALHKCARWDRMKLAQILMERGANIHIKNTDGYKAKDMTPDVEFKKLLSNL